MKRVLFVGDAVVSTGFAKGTHAYCDGLQAAGYDVHVLGMHFTGDPHHYPYPIYTCWPGRDQFGVGRIRNMVRQLQPDVIVIQQDPWNFPKYLTNLGADKRDGLNFNHVPVVGVVAVDGENCQGDKLGPIDGAYGLVHPGLSAAVFWTKFGMNQARYGGWRGPSTVIPLGVDLSIYQPLNRAEIKRTQLAPILRSHGLSEDSFVVGCVGRNQLRKRLDLTLQYFSEWVHRKKINNAVLWMHCAPTGDDAFDIKSLAEYFGIKGRVLVPDVNPRYGVSEATMAQVYNMFDALLSTSVGEGMGLPALEAMACGTPCVLSKWSAYAEWAVDAAWLAECTSIAVAPKINTVGGVAGPEVIEALRRLYLEPHSWKALSEAGIKLAGKLEYRWIDIGARFADVIGGVLKPKETCEEMWADLGRPEDSHAVHT